MNKNIQWENLFNNYSTPIAKLIRRFGVNIVVKRDDLNHPVVQGNKLRKLKYNVKYALDYGYDTIATFGGPFSNHIAATAAVAKFCHLKSIGFIRGDELQFKKDKWSNTLKTAHSDGMQLVFLSRSEYKIKEKSIPARYILHGKLSKIYILPEGGSNEMAVNGVSEIIEELLGQMDVPDYLITACGTGGTMAGLIKGVTDFNWNTQIVGIPVLKGAEFLAHDIENLINQKKSKNWQLIYDYHFSGYAKSNQKLQEFCDKFHHDNSFKLDKIYNAKSFFATYDLINKGYFNTGSTIVILHTGGLQGGIL